LGSALAQRSPEKARHEFLNSPPGKAGFSVSRSLLLGGLPPYLDELFQHQAAVAQALAFLELVKKSYGFTRQVSDELKAALRSNSASISAASVAVGVSVVCMRPPVRARDSLVRHYGQV